MASQTQGRQDGLRVPSAVVILLAFLVGLAGGAAAPGAASYIVPFGTVWVRAVSALVVPLVTALLITGITSLAGTGAVGRLGATALAVFLALLALGSVAIALVTPTLLTLLDINGASLGALGRASAVNGPVVPAHTPAGFWPWVEALIPANPVAAASSGALLPLVIFTVAFAVALAGLAPESRSGVVAFFRGVADAMLVLVRWVLWLAPAGVLALAYGLGAHAGVGSARALVTWVVLVASACVVFLVALYAIAVFVGRVPLLRFSRSIARAQIVAFSSRSSLAALPAMIEGGETGLRLPSAITGFLLPLAVSTFKMSATIAVVTGTLFLARLYTVPITPGGVISIAASAVLLSFTVPGVPGGFLVVMLPVLASAGIPAEGIGILFAMDAIPDMFRTLTNVTADMVAAVIVARHLPAARTDSSVPLRSASHDHVRAQCEQNDRDDTAKQVLGNLAQ